MSGMCSCRLPLLACKDPTAFGAAKGLAGRGKHFFRLILLMGRVSSRIDRNKIKRWQQTSRKYQKIRSQMEHIEPPWSPSPPFVRKRPLDAGTCTCCAAPWLSRSLQKDGTSAGTQDSKAVRVIARTGSGVGSLVSLHNGTSRVDRAETWLEVCLGFPA